jgi:hypothetical protein
MNPPSIKLLALAGGLVLIVGAFYALGDGWTPWADGPSRAAAIADPATRSIGNSAAADDPASSSPGRTTTLVVHSHYELQGVVAGATPDAPGLALIAVDGAAARTVRVGEALGDGLALLGVSPGGALLGPPGGPAVMVLEVVVASAAPGVSGSVTAGAAQGTWQGAPSLSAIPMPLPPGSNAGALSAAGEPGDSLAADAVGGQVLIVPANDLLIDTGNGGRPVKHPGRHQRLHSVKPGS